MPNEERTKFILRKILNFLSGHSPGGGGGGGTSIYGLYRYVPRDRVGF